MKTAFAATVALALAFAPTAFGHGAESPGSVLTIYPDQADTGIFALVESLAPNTIPNGLFYFTIGGVTPGNNFAATADDGQTPFVIGTASSCPGPRAEQVPRSSDPAVDDGPDYDPSGGAFPLPDDVGGEDSAADNRIDTTDYWLEDPNNNIWVLCNNHPDFDLKFTSGDYTNGPGDESGVVPGDAAACADGSCQVVVTLFFGDPGEAFTYHEGF